MTQPPQTPAQDSIEKIADEMAKRARMNATPADELLLYYAQRLRALPSLAELERDAERLDFLERGARKHWNGTIGSPETWTLTGWPFNLLRGPTLREAIDAARAKEGKTI